MAAAATRRRHILLLLLLPYHLASCLTKPSIRVWDNCISPVCAQACHEVAVASGLNHKLCSLGDQPMSTLENTLQSIVRELHHHDSVEDTFIEYWCRQEWRHIEAHADVDEQLYKDAGSISYPTKGHVLYLQVGNEAKGPTCIFDNCNHGGHLLENESTKLTTVPAVNGRLLQFQGDLLHAVPRPTDLWSLPFVQGVPDYDAPQFLRSVVLFNIWTPRKPVGVSPNDEAVVDSDVGVCNLMKDWKSVDIVTPTESPKQQTSDKTKIWLLGDEQRRQHALRTINMYSDEQQLSKALSESSSVTTVSLQREPLTIKEEA